ncbi:hypothetical protein B0H10DRAFT_2187722 [Mycena sp. CBHHK59/15]|nr:hypothetical protein B0H10DRAFT_2187722 [Mycena sp. CBHHK59/15]
MLLHPCQLRDVPNFDPPFLRFPTNAHRGFFWSVWRPLPNHFIEGFLQSRAEYCQYQDETVQSKWSQAGACNLFSRIVRAQGVWTANRKGYPGSTSKVDFNGGYPGIADRLVPETMAENNPLGMCAEGLTFLQMKQYIDEAVARSETIFTLSVKVLALTRINPKTGNMFWIDVLNCTDEEEALDLFSFVVLGRHVHKQPLSQ